MKIEFQGHPQKGIYSKDFILALIAKYGVDAGVGYAVEYSGDAISDLSMEERMTICNMSIEFGAKIGLMNPDEKTYDYVKGREHAPKNFDEAVSKWEKLVSDSDAQYDKILSLDVSQLKPMVTWGTNPGMGLEFGEKFPEINNDLNYERAYQYMDLKPGQTASAIDLGYIFIGSCTNARLGDLEEAAKIIGDRHIADGLTGIVVPGSRPVKEAAEAQGLDKIFKEAGFEWREPGCSACLGMNPDQIPEYVHCASTSNRNFE